MVNHPNRKRGPKGPAGNPDPSEIKAARLKIGLSPKEAAALVHCAARTWQQWETGDRRMHPGLWELFHIKSAEESQ